MKRLKMLLATTGLLLSSFSWLAVISVGAVPDDLICTWTAGGADDKFSNVDNWDGGDSLIGCQQVLMEDSALFNLKLVFPAMANATDRLPVNDLTANTKVSSITITGTGYTISGTNPLTLMGDITSSGSSNTISTPLVLGANATIAAGSGTLTHSGTLNLATYTLSLTGGTMSLNGVISSGTGGSITSAVTNLTLGGTNTFKGTFTSTAGTVTATNKSAFGDTTSGSVFNDLSSLKLNTSIAVDETWAEAFTFNGAKNSSQPGKIVLDGAGTNVQGMNGPYYVLSGAVVLGADLEVANVGLNDSADLKLTGALSGAFKIKVAEGQDLAVVVGGSSNTTTTTNGTYRSAAQAITITNSMTTTLYYNQTGNLNKDITATSLTVNGGTLKGEGKTTALSMSNGSVAPGMSPGCLYATGTVSFSGGTYSVELGGDIVCTGYDQLVVESTGSVNLGSNVTTLSLSLVNSFVPEKGDTFTIINNKSTSATSGKFKDINEGGLVTSNGVTYKVSYVGGDGNDVVLTVDSVSANAGTGSNTTVPNAPNTGVTPAKVFANLVIVSFIGVAISWVLVNNNKRSTVKGKK